MDDEEITGGDKIIDAQIIEKSKILGISMII